MHNLAILFASDLQGLRPLFPARAQMVLFPDGDHVSATIVRLTSKHHEVLAPTEDQAQGRQPTIDLSSWHCLPSKPAATG
jgi:hypothetical protein